MTDIKIENNYKKSNSNPTTHGANLPKLKIMTEKPHINREIESPEKEINKCKCPENPNLGDDFVPPDGGWGWIVAFARGVNILVTFALAQQFGVIFRDHMKNLGNANSELTTIINIQVDVSAFTGLFNGPLFRSYTYRQVALMGSALTFLGHFLTIFANFFGSYVLGFSCIYGFGRGLTVSASSLAVNTYFKLKRRTATVYQLGVAGLGLIVCPYFAIYLLTAFGVQGTMAIFAALSLHTIACSLIYQPVKCHVVKYERYAEVLHKNDDNKIDRTAELETPILPLVSDGWYGSFASLNVNSYSKRLGHWEKQQTGNGHFELKHLNSQNSGAIKPPSFSITHSIKEEVADIQIDDNAIDVHDNNDSTKDQLAVKEIKPLPGILKPFKQFILIKSAYQLELEEKERYTKLPFHKKILQQTSPC